MRAPFPVIAAAATIIVVACREADRTPMRYGIGRPAAQATIDSLDTDVDATGHGLPAGHGDATQGATLFQTKCSMCHGAKGEGMAPVYPALIGREPRQGFPFASDFKLTKTIGNYWPYATTVYDYIQRAMPFTAPGSLSHDEIYSLTAYLLAANEILPAGATLDSASLARVRMPARDRFVRDDRRGGPEIR